jgi:hypothetical protein
LRIFAESALQKFITGSRQVASLKKGQRAPVPAIVQERGKGEAREQAAQLVGTGARYISDAKRIQAEAPQMLEEIRSGSKIIPEVEREIIRTILIPLVKLRRTARRQPLPPP